jgi:hypothetical protein
MAHFAQLNESNEVVNVIVIDNSDITIDGMSEEEAGIQFLNSILPNKIWKQTSYNSLFRKNFAGIGYKYMPNIDAFVPSKPYESWVLNETTGTWEAPSVKPEGNYKWDELTTSWTQGETPAE